MNDQAMALRRLMEQTPAPPPTTPVVPIIIVGSGKGGVGKSVFAAQLASSAARRGHRVLLVDGDQNLGNLHVLLGLHPTARLETLVLGDVAPTDLVIPVHENLSLLPGDSGAEMLHGIATVDRARLHHRLTTVFQDYEFVVVDAGAGIDCVVRCCAVMATMLIMITVPEPASLTDAYAVTKIVSLQVPALPVSIVVNRVRTDEEGPAVHDKIQTACRRFLNVQVNYLGAIPEDDALAHTIRQALNLLVNVRDTKFGCAVDAIVHEQGRELGLLCARMPVAAGK